MAQTEVLPAIIKPRTARVADPCVMVIFGYSGDLTRRKLIPALYNLASQQALSREFAVIGVGRTPMSNEDARKKLTEDFKQFATGAIDKDLWEWFVQRVSYVNGDFDDPATYDKLKDALATVDKEFNSHGNYFFYLATAPNYFGDIVERLSKVGLMHEDNGHWRRVIIEKPFGHDLESAKALNQQLLKVVAEQQIYRIDHYLGKETVQNILALRFANGIFEPIWNRRYIDHVQISVAETVGVEKRGGYYDAAGALRDMVPNHIMQLITLTAMEPPISFEANAVRDEQAKILHAIQPYSDEDVLSKTVRGQYGEGVMDNERVPAYRSEDGVPPDSRTETFVAMRLLIDNWRWAGVPFYLRTGKRLAKRTTEIMIQFKRAPHMVFRDKDIQANRLVLNIQPSEGICISFGAKKPGTEMNIGNVAMDFNYIKAFGNGSRSAYATLLNDCLRGDATLFDRGDSVEAAWTLIDPILDVWSAAKTATVPEYSSGSWGPKESDQLLERDARQWYNP
jgi:glucose-6-phosphate 1-dehydrogenase